MVLIYPVIYYAFYIILFIASLAFKVKTNLREAKSFLILVVISTTLLAFFFIPNTNFRWDLHFHFELIDKMRSASSLKQALDVSQYKNLYFINFLYFLLSRQPYNQIVPAFFVLIDTSIFAYIFYNSLKNKVNKNQTLSFNFFFFVALLFLSSIDLILAITGIRNVFAIALVSLAVYLDLVKRKHKIFSLFLYLAAVFTHQFAFFIIAIRLFIIIIKRVELLYVMMILWLFGVQFLNIFKIFNISYITNLVNWVVFYWNSYSFTTVINEFHRSTQLIYILNILMVFSYWIMARRNYKINSGKNLLDNKVNKYFYSTSIIGLAFASNYLLLQRFMYILAYNLVMFLPTQIYGLKKIKKSFNLMIFSATFYLIIVLYQFLSNAFGFFLIELIK